MFFVNGLSKFSLLLHPYDFRGKYPDVLNDATAFSIARAFADTLRASVKSGTPTVAVGRDARLSSPALEEAVVRGFVDGGVNVVRLGLTSTPTFYFAVAYFGSDGGIQITASHNPVAENGLKLVRRNAEPVHGQNGLSEIAALAERRAFTVASSKGSIRSRSDATDRAAQEYIRLAHIRKMQPLRVLADAGNGMGALDMAATFQRLPCRATPLYFRLDGTFPNRGPDPSIDANLRNVQTAIRSEGADVGFASDGDGDRYFVLDERGRVVPHAILRGLVAQMALQHNPGATICYDIRPGRVTKEMIEAAGGKAVATPVGSPYIKDIMRREGAAAGVESSGHFFFRFPFGIFEAPAHFLASLLDFVSGQNKPLSKIVAPYEKYAHSGEINVAVSDIPLVLTHVKTAHRDGTLSEVDGVSVEYADWWFNLRPSNTERLVRLTVEGVTQNAMEKGRDRVLREIQETENSK